MSALPSQISGLSVAEKLELLDALWLDIEAQDLELSEEQSAELDRRVARYEQDRSGTTSWEKIKADLLKQ